MERHWREAAPEVVCAVLKRPRHSHPRHPRPSKSAGTLVRLSTVVGEFEWALAVPLGFPRVSLLTDPLLQSCFPKAPKAPKARENRRRPLSELIARQSVWVREPPCPRIACLHLMISVLTIPLMLLKYPVLVSHA